MIYSDLHLSEATEVIKKIETKQIEKIVDLILNVRNEKGRIFFLGVGGSAGNCSHAVNDFRKIIGVESYAPTDNVSELTARTNDDGWETVFSEWLKVSKLSKKDAVLVFSVGGGNIAMNVSVNLVNALKYSKEVEAKVLGIVGRDGGFTKHIGDSVVVVPVVNADLVTAHTEAFHAVIWHCFVSHPNLQIKDTKW